MNYLISESNWNLTSPAGGLSLTEETWGSDWPAGAASRRVRRRSCLPSLDRGQGRRSRLVMSSARPAPPTSSHSTTPTVSSGPRLSTIPSWWIWWSQSQVRTLLTFQYHSQFVTLSQVQVSRRDKPCMVWGEEWTSHQLTLILILSSTNCNSFY